MLTSAYRSPLIHVVALRSTRPIRFVQGLVCFLMLWMCQPVWGASQIKYNGAATIVNTGSLSLGYPSNVVTDSSGNSYIADSGSDMIIKLSRDGIASHLAITGLSPALSQPVGLAIAMSRSISRRNRVGA